jgi:thioredoxin 1
VVEDEIMTSVQSVSQAQLNARVLRSEGPIALDFYQASCPPCRLLEPRLERVARDYEGRLRVYRVDIDRDLPVAQRFGIMSIPTILLLKGGQELESLDGLITEQDLRAAFDRAVSR